MSPESHTAGLCLSVIEKLYEHALAHNIGRVDCKFAKAVSKGINPPGQNEHHQYIGSYISEEWKHALTVKELAAIREAWAKHIARSIYEQIEA